MPVLSVAVRNVALRAKCGQPRIQMMGGHHGITNQSPSTIRVSEDHVMKNGVGKRILLVNDDKALLRSLTDYLVIEGDEVVVAHNGKDALARMDESAPDILVLDINMPGMGSLEVLRRIQGPDGRLPYPTLVKLVGPTDPWTLLKTMESVLGP